MLEVGSTCEGLRHRNQLPGKVRDAAIRAILGPLAERPRRVGEPLVGELTGLYSARRGDYRVIYEIDDDRKVVIVHRARTAASSIDRVGESKEQESAQNLIAART